MLLIVPAVLAVALVFVIGLLTRKRALILVGLPGPILLLFWYFLASARPDPQTEFVAPRNALEQQLAAIWRAVLHIEQVGIHDNFFLLGGHSLLATRVASQIRTQFNVDLPIKTVFETTNFAELARALELSTRYRAATVVFDEQDEEF